MGYTKVGPSPIVNFTSEYVKPLVALKTAITAQGGGGTPQSANPIIGFSEVNLTRAGKNLASTHQGNGFVDNKFLFNDNTYYSADNYYVTEYLHCPSKLYLSSDSTGTYSSICFYDANLTFISAVEYRNNTSMNIPIPSGSKFFRASVRKESHFQLEDNTQATAYAPYNADTFTLPLGQTVYGGYVDWKNGKLVITHGVADLSDTSLFKFSYDNSSKRWQTTFSNIKVFTQRSAEVLAEEWKADTTATVGEENKFFTVGGALYFYTADNVNKPQGKLVYPLATPIEISLPTTMPQTIEGVQNWFADSGDIELEYKKIM